MKIFLIFQPYPYASAPNAYAQPSASVENHQEVSFQLVVLQQENN